MRAAQEDSEDARLTRRVVEAIVEESNDAEFEKELQEVQPTHVMSFIGRTHGATEDGHNWTTIDYLEQPGKMYENVRDNMFSPLVCNHPPHSRRALNHLIGC